jgi:predicted membrane protein
VKNPGFADFLFTTFLRRPIFAIENYITLKLKNMEPSAPATPDRRSRKLAFGVIIMAAGFLLLGFNLNFLPYTWKEIFFSWQMLLIAIGVISIFSRDSWVPGVILITIGSFFLLPKLFFLPHNFMHYFWPLILIIAGVVILLRRYPRHHRSHASGQNVYERTSEEGVILEDVVFGNSKQRITSQAFKGGKVSCVFANAEVDLTQAQLAVGIHELELNAVFAGITVILPVDWKVEMKMSSVLGGFADKRTFLKESPDPSKVLVIKGSAVFGGGEIRSY